MKYFKTVGELMDALAPYPREHTILNGSSKHHTSPVRLEAGYYCKPTRTMHISHEKAEGALEALQQTNPELYQKWAKIKENLPLIEETVILYHF